MKRKKAKYPDGVIPSRKVVETFKTQPSTCVRCYGCSNKPAEDERKIVPFGPYRVEEGELEALYQKNKDWNTVYALYNMD